MMLFMLFPVWFLLNAVTMKIIAKGNSFHTGILNSNGNHVVTKILTEIGILEDCPALSQINLYH